MRHGVNDHNAGAYYMLTGRYPAEGSKLVAADGPHNFPPFGAVAAKLLSVGRPLPAFVHLPEYQWNNGVDIAGLARLVPILSSLKRLNSRGTRAT